MTAASPRLSLRSLIVSAKATREKKPWKVVGLPLALEAALELEQGGVLDEKQCEATEVTIAQAVAYFAQLAGVDDTGYAAGDGVDEERKRSKTGPLRSPLAM